MTAARAATRKLMENWQFWFGLISIMALILGSTVSITQRLERGFAKSERVPALEDSTRVFSSRFREQYHVDAEQNRRLDSLEQPSLGRLRLLQQSGGTGQ